MAEHGLTLKSVTVPTYHMDRAVDFYEKMGFTVTYGGKDSDFTSVKIGNHAHINLVVRGILSTLNRTIPAMCGFCYECGLDCQMMNHTLSAKLLVLWNACCCVSTRLSMFMSPSDACKFAISFGYTRNFQDRPIYSAIFEHVVVYCLRPVLCSQVLVFPFNED